MLLLFVNKTDLSGVVDFAVNSSNPWYPDSYTFLYFSYLWKQQEDFQTWRNLFSFQKLYLRRCFINAHIVKTVIKLFPSAIIFRTLPSDSVLSHYLQILQSPLSFLWYNSHWQPNEPFLLIIHMNWMWAFHLTLRFFAAVWSLLYFSPNSSCFSFSANCRCYHRYQCGFF